MTQTLFRTKIVLFFVSSLSMISISPTAQEYFRKLIEQQDLPGLGIRLVAVHPGTPRADCQLEFCEPGERDGSEFEIPCGAYSLFVAADSLSWLEAANIDFIRSGTGGELTIRAPALRGAVPAADTSLSERVRYVIESEINPQLASHGGHISLDSITPEGIVVLRFGGGCHGCGMADQTLRNGVETTLKARLAEVTGVRDATDHGSGDKPYYARQANA